MNVVTLFYEMAWKRWTQDMHNALYDAIPYFSSKDKITKGGMKSPPPHLYQTKIAQIQDYVAGNIKNQSKQDKRVKIKRKFHKTKIAKF